MQNATVTDDPKGISLLLPAPMRQFSYRLYTLSFAEIKSIWPYCFSVLFRI